MSESFEYVLERSQESLFFDDEKELDRYNCKSQKA